MTQLRALAYADFRALVNDGRRAVRSPGRIALWIGYAVLLALFFVSRVIAHPHRSVGATDADLVRADFFMCALLVLLALSLATGRGAIGIFRSRAEARFIIGSPVAAPLAIAYLQAREAFAQGLRFLFSLIYLIFIFGPRQLGAIVVLADITLVLALVSAAAAVVVPRRLLRAPAGIACMAVGAPLALLAVAPVVRDVAGQFPLPPVVANRILAIVPAWHPGTILLHPNPLWLVLALAIVAVAVAVLASSGRDAYPELYALSIARIDRRERVRLRMESGRAQVQARRPRREPGRTALPSAGARSPGLPAAPPGVSIFVWKSVVEFGRQRPAPYIVVGSALWCVAGFAGARFMAADKGALFAALTGVLINLFLLVGIAATGAIAGEVRRPLFWLAGAALFERLCALAFARIWRTIATLELVAVSFALGGGGLRETLVFAIGLPALVALLAGVAFAAFALFPSSADWRGPVAALRLGVSALLLVPPLALYGVAAVGFRAPLAGLFAATLLALIEAGGLIGVAAWKLDGRIDRLAA